MDAAINEADLFDDDDVSADELALLQEAGDRLLRPDDIEDENSARSDAETEADFAAGRYVTNDQVMEWLTSLGTDDPLPRPTWRN